MIKHLDYHGICPWCGRPFKDGLIEIKIITFPPNRFLGVYGIGFEYAYDCDNCGNRTIVASGTTNTTDSELARAAKVVAKNMRKKVERYDKLHD